MGLFPTRVDLRPRIRFPAFLSLEEAQPFAYDLVRRVKLACGYFVANEFFERRWQAYVHSAMVQWKAPIVNVAWKLNCRIGC